MFGTKTFIHSTKGYEYIHVSGQEAKSYFGLFCRPFATALAHLSFASIAEKLMEKNSEGFGKALDREAGEIFNGLW